VRCPHTADLIRTSQAMRQRFLWVCLWLSVGFATCVQDRAAAQSATLGDDPTVTAGTDPAGCPIRYTLRHFAGEAPGYDTGLTRFELFIPLMETDASNLLFCDLQPLIDNHGNWGSNLGLGYRWYSPTLDRVFGAYAYYDYRETDYHRFGQATLGLDSLGNWVDVRGNVYLPSQDWKQLPSEAVAVPHFQGHSLRYGGYESAMLGGDCEVGVRLPLIMGTQSRLLAGVYGFDGNGEEDVQGWKVRLETQWTAEVSTDVAYYDDDVFGTSLMVGIAFNLQSESFSPWAPQIHSFRRGSLRHITNVAADRIAEPTYRQPNIAIRNGTYRATTDGNPWQIIHVMEGATGGDGSFERPFGTLDQAMAAATPGTIVYTPYGGDYQPTPMFVVPDGVSLLSNAPVQLVQTDVGWMQLPLSGASPDLSAAPEILGSVQMSSGATLNGFRVIGIGDTLGEAGVVWMSGVSDVTVANNAIWSRQRGIWIEDAMNVTVADNTVTQALGSGIFMASGTNVALTRNVIQQADGDGIEVVAGPGAIITDNTVGEALGSGISVTDASYAQITGNQIGNVGQHGIEVIDGQSVNVANNEIHTALGDGITLGDAVNASVTNNLIESAQGHGIEFVTGTDATVSGNQIGEVGGHGITLADAANADISGNSIESAGQDGIQIGTGTGAAIARNTIGAAIGNGIRVGDATNASLVGNQIALAGANGLLVDGGMGLEVLDNEIQQALQNGIAIHNVANATLANNVLRAVGGDGIRIVTGSHIEISGNRLEIVDTSGLVLVGVEHGLVADNIIEFAGQHGIQVVDGDHVGITANTVERAMGNGIDISGVDFLGTVGGNTITEAQTGVQAILSREFSGAISDNLLVQNRVNGIHLQAGLFAEDSVVSGNTMEQNGAEGLSLLYTGAETSTLEVYDNVMVLNNVILGVQHREFVARLASGAGSWIVDLSGNKSYNLPPAGEFNYDFLNLGGLDLLYQDDGTNHGTLGSSDGSVPPP